MATYRIAELGGDGIGPEVIEAAKGQWRRQLDDGLDWALKA